MTWVSLALALLKFVNAIILWARERELISEGYDKAIAEQAAAILKKQRPGRPFWSGSMRFLMTTLMLSFVALNPSSCTPQEIDSFSARSTTRWFCRRATGR
jgi:hypothetical protein